MTLTPEQEVRVEALQIATDLAIARAKEYKRKPTTADVLGLVTIFEHYIEGGMAHPSRRKV